MTMAPGALVVYAAAAFAEISGCYAFWAWARLDRAAIWLLPGIVSLAVFAWLLTRIHDPFAGRAYAAYGGVYIVASLAWLWLVERHPPDRWDLIGGVICLVGACVILFAPHAP